MLNYFCSILNSRTYSKYYSLIDKNNNFPSLKSFLETMRHPKKYKQLTFIEEFSRKFPLDTEENKESIITKRNKLNEFLDKLEVDYKEKLRLNKKINKKDLHFKKHFCIELTPDPFSYNPNYDCRFTRIPICKIYSENPKKYNDNNSSIKFNNISIYKINNSNLRKKIVESKNLTPIDKKFSNTNYNEDNNPFKLKEAQFDKKGETSFEINKKLILPIPKNIPEKTKDKKLNYTKFYRNTNSSPTKGNIDFNKMTYRKWEVLLNKASFKIPSFDRYKPMYNYIRPHTKGINFGKNTKTPSDKKKFLIKKLWCSYGFLDSHDYNIIDNSKLNKH